MAKVAGAYPIFGQFMEQKGLKYIVKNLEIDGRDQMLDEASEFMQQIEQQQQAAQQAAAQGQQQPNPMMMDMQLKAQKQQQDAALDQAKMHNEQQRIELEAERLELEKQKVQSQVALSARDQNVQEDKAATERMAKAADISLEREKHMHNVAKDIMSSKNG